MLTGLSYSAHIYIDWRVKVRANLKKKNKQKNTALQNDNLSSAAVCFLFKV